MVAGAFISALYFLRVDHSFLAKPAEVSVPPSKTTPKVELAVKPDFDFYSILPDLEVPVSHKDQDKAPPLAPPPALQQPVVAAVTAPHAPPSQPAVSTTPPPLPPSSSHAPADNKPGQKVSYLLQLASFKKASDAENLQARLALLGIEAQVQKVTIDNTTTYHRVKSGPYPEGAEFDGVRKTLEQNQLQAMVVRLRN